MRRQTFPHRNVSNRNRLLLFNLDSVFLRQALVSVGPATILAGYNLSLDTGDGRAMQDQGLTNLAASDTAAWSTSPVTYQGPMARLSIELLPKTQWNFGLELYRYNQKFSYYGYQPY